MNFYVGCFTKEGEIRSAIREYKSSTRANYFFKKQTERILKNEVIYSFAYPINVPSEGSDHDEVLAFRKLCKEYISECYSNGMWTLKTFYPQEYKKHMAK